MGRVLWGFFALASAVAQHLSVGVNVAGRLTDDIEGNARSESKVYAVGPAVEWRLPAGLAIEAGALYRRAGYRSTTTDILGGTYFGRSRANSWEFPMVLKRRLPLGLFVAGGYAPRTMRFTDTASGIQVDIFGVRRPAPPATYTWPRRVSHGGLVAAGVEFGSRHLRLAPQFRYTRWNNRPVDVQGSRGYYVQSRQNQADLLLGLRWR